MVTLNIPESLATKLSVYADREGRSMEAMLEKLILEYDQTPPEARDLAAQSAAMEAISGLFDDDATDLSLIVKESVQNALRKKYGSAR